MEAIKAQSPTSRKSRKIELNPKDNEANEVLLNSLCSQIKTVDANGYAKLVNYSSQSHHPIHRWFRYREGYSLELVKELISDLPKGSIIVDPFCGCGTTLLAAQELGYKSYGFDINPMSVLISKVKTRSYDNHHLTLIEDGLTRIKKLNVNSPRDSEPRLKIIDKVFHREILDALLVLRNYINSIEEEFVHDFFKVAWLSILEGVSNVYKEGNGIKYRNKKRTPDGYITIPETEWQASLFPPEKFDFVLNSFIKKIREMYEDIKSREGLLPEAIVYEGTAENISEHLEENSVSYVVFSPPYCNCFNYFKIFKIELWMGEFVKDYSEIKELNRRAMRSHVETVLEREGDEYIPQVDKFVDLIDETKLWDKRIPRAVRGYFIDMKSVLKDIEKVLKPGGKCTIVVGNSAYTGIVVPTDALLANIASENGFNIEHLSVARHLTTSSQQKLLLNGLKDYLRESLVFLEKPDPRLIEQDIEVVDEFPIDVSKSSRSAFVVRNSGLTNLTHKFHRYPGKFIPHIPRWAINKYLKNKQSGLVFDPFCGSGTTNVEAMLLGHSSYGMDVDFISRLLTKVKTTSISQRKLEKVVNEVLGKVNRRRRARFKPEIETLSHWFNDSAVTELGIIRDVIESYSDNVDIFNFLLVCYLAVIRRASNADNQTMKTYVSHTHPKDPESARVLFNKVLPEYAKRITEFSKLINKNVSTNVLSYSDSRSFSNEWEKDNRGKVDLIVTSPPYLKSVDYVYNQMAEYFWIGDLYNMENQTKQNIKKKDYIGTEKVVVKEYKSFIETGLSELDELNSRIFRKSPKHAYIVSKYFLDMERHFLEARNIINNGGHYVMVVGDTLVSNETVLVHRYIQSCAEKHGFSVSNVFAYEIRNRHMRFPRQGRGGIIRYDWVLDFVAGNANSGRILLEERER